MKRTWLLAVLLLALFGAACSGDDDAGDADGAAGDAGPVVAVAGSDLGDILVDGDGITLYMFIPDEQGPSVCNDDCAGNWPPLTSDAAAGDGLDASLLSSAVRDDGAEQVTYDGWPLYYFGGDAAAGDVNGQGVGDVWFVISPTGEPIQ